MAVGTYDLSDTEWQDVVITCPPENADGPAAEIRARGNIPLDINGNLIAELQTHDMRESWASARKLNTQQICSMTRDLGSRLSNADTGEALDGKIADAAAFFLLALRHQHMTPSKATRGCRITWHTDTAQEEVEYLR